jgi:hypothetical protein
MNLCEYIYYTSQAILSWVSRGRDCMVDEFTTKSNNFLIRKRKNLNTTICKYYAQYFVGAHDNACFLR